MSKDEIWLENFNPCGGTLVRGYGNRTCVDEGCGKLPCLLRGSFITAQDLAGGEEETVQKEGITKILSELIGTRVVGVDGKQIEINNQNLGLMAQAMLDRAHRFMDGVNSCERNTVPIGPTTMSELTPEKQKVLEHLRFHISTADHFKGTSEGAESLALRIQAKLRQAINQGLGNIDLIARLALAYGLGDELPVIDETGQIFKGDPKKMIQMEE